ncbi:MAG: DNA repair protein RecO C-terminal domain-containing protein, partial [Anaerolineae bacterium]|nr:DNA repair protein RecO C-terminal domain-containing protein [Anaerolineae bacterium]
LSRRALKAMRFALRSTYPAFRAAPFSPQTIQELGEILSQHLMAILERRPRSLAFLSKLTRPSLTEGGSEE